MDKTIDHRLAWLAGIIDGEGWIGFRLVRDNPSHAKRRSGKRFQAAAWYIAVANTDEAMLVEIMSISAVVGAKWMFQPSIKRAGNRKPQGRVTWHTKRDCALVLWAILPFLVTKRAHADLMLQAIHHRQRQPHCRKPGYVPADHDADFMAMSDQIREMNRRGIRAPEGGHKWPE